MPAKQRKMPVDLSHSGFDEAIARLIQGVPSALADSHQRMKEQAAEFERDANAYFAEIQSGDRRFKRPYRP